MKVESLTEAQASVLSKYRDKGIELGMKCDPSLDESLVRELTDAHRVLCGHAKASIFLVLDSPMAAKRNIPELDVGNALYGQHDASWLMFLAFFRIECGLTEETDKVQHLISLLDHVGWMWMGQSMTVVTRRPKLMHTVTKNRPLGAGGPLLQVLHHEDRLALEYVDGEGVYALNGLRVPDGENWIVKTPREELDPTRVLAIQNTELRTEALKKMGVEHMRKALHSRTLNKAKFGESDYELFELQVNAQKRIYLTSTCPSSAKPFYEAVPPDISTVAEALSWRETGVAVKKYTPPSIRT